MQFLLFNILEEAKFSGEGEYNLNVLKRIDVTDSFLGLNAESRGCQNKEPFENCTTRNYEKTLLEQCKCLPFNMVLSSRVYRPYLIQINQIIQIFNYMFKVPICTSSQLKCVKKIAKLLKIDSNDCISYCSGLIVSGFSKAEPPKDLNDLIVRDIITYRKYTKWTPLPSFLKG